MRERESCASGEHVAGQKSVIEIGASWTGDHPCPKNAASGIVSQPRLFVNNIGTDDLDPCVEHLPLALCQDERKDLFLSIVELKVETFLDWQWSKLTRVFPNTLLLLVQLLFSPQVNSSQMITLFKGNLGFIMCVCVCVYLGCVFLHIIITSLYHSFNPYLLRLRYPHSFFRVQVSLDRFLCRIHNCKSLV